MKKVIYEGEPFLTTYLAGPINGCSDGEANDWRNEAIEWLDTKTKNPMDRDYRGRELDEGIATEIVENDKIDINESQIVLVMYPGPSAGTCMETIYSFGANRKKNEDNYSGKLVVVVDKSGKPLSPWMIYHSDKVFTTLKEACDWINAYQQEIAKKRISNMFG